MKADARTINSPYINVNFIRQVFRALNRTQLATPRSPAVTSDYFH